MKRIYLVAVFLAVVLVTNVIVFSTAAQGRWVLQDGYPQVNPNNDQLEFYGGDGGTPGWYDESRYNGKFRIYTVSETSFSFEDSEVDHEFEYWHVTLQSDFDFDKPVNILIPGETVTLNVNFSKSGTVTDGNPGIQFQLMGFGIDVQPETFFNYYPWDSNFGGVSSTTYSFVVPPTHSGEILMDAFLRSASGCLVRWAYEAEESTTTVPASTTTTTTPADTTTTTTGDCPPYTSACGNGCCNIVELCCDGSYCCSGECCDGDCCGAYEICSGLGCVPEDSFFACIPEWLFGEDSVEVEILRDFRDNVLSQTPVGQEIIELYYLWSPAIVQAMEADEAYKEEVKEMVDGVLELIE